MILVLQGSGSRFAQLCFDISVPRTPESGMYVSFLENRARFDENEAMHDSVWEGHADRYPQSASW